MTLSIYLLTASWAVWLGTIVFFSFVVAPTVHGVLDRESAAALLRTMFPRYYLTGAACGLLGTAAALAVRADLRVTVPLVVGTVLSVYAWQVLTPALDAARIAGADDRSASLHVLSVRLNLIVLALLILVGTVVAGR